MGCKWSEVQILSPRPVSIRVSSRSLFLIFQSGTTFYSTVAMQWGCCINPYKAFQQVTVGVTLVSVMGPLRSRFRGVYFVRGGEWSDNSSNPNPHVFTALFDLFEVVTRWGGTTFDSKFIYVMHLNIEHIVTWSKK